MMISNGTATIAAAQADVWAFLTDPNEVAKCVPGIEEMTVLEPDHRFRAIASIGLGNIRARFVTDVEWLELSPNSFAKMKAHGTAPGSAADVIAEMTLVHVSDHETRLEWTAEISIVGTLASLANRMLDSVSAKMAEQFFQCVRVQIEK